MNGSDQLLDVAPLPEAGRPKVRRGVHVQGLVSDVVAAVEKYRRSSHASRKQAAKRARAIARALEERG